MYILVLDSLSVLPKCIFFSINAVITQLFTADDQYASQVTDYAIARRIVDLHSRVEESVDRLYTLDEIRRYLLFARQFKPKVCVISHVH